MNKNGVKLLAAVAVFAMMFAGVAVVLSDNGDVDAASGDTTYISGTITAGTDQKYTAGSKVIVNGDLTIPSTSKLTIQGASLTVNEGVTVTIEAGGELIVDKDTVISNGSPVDVQPTVNIYGKIVAKGNNPSAATITNNAAAPNGTDKTGFYVYGNITLSEGATMTGTAGNVVVLSGGSIDITKKNSNVSSMENQTVCIAEGVTFTMAGYATDVTVTAYTGSDKYYQTSKVVINDGAPGNTEAKKTSTIVIKTVVEKNQAKFGADETSADAASKVTMKNYVMDVSGTIKNGDAVSIDKMAVSCDGNTSGDYYTLNSKGKIVDKILPTTTISGAVVVDELGKMTIDNGSKLIISGDLSVAYDKTNINSKNRIDLDGEVVITGTASMNWETLVDNASNPTGKLKMDGGLLTIVGYEDVNFGGTKACVGEFYGAYYTVESLTEEDVTYFCDLKKAITDAAAANVDEVVVYAGKNSENSADADAALKAGAYVVEDGTVVPEGMTLAVMNALVIPKDATMTFEVGSDLSTVYGTKNLFVSGKLVDNDEIIYGTSNEDKVYFQVSKYNEETNVAVFTTLKIALDEAVSGEVITLKVAVKIDDNMTIPTGVIVKTIEESNAITFDEEKTLTINGTLYLPSSGTMAVGSGKVILNGNIAYLTGNYTAIIAGAYYELDYENETYKVISSAALAAERSAQVETSIDFYGKISANDLVFNEGDENDLVITINNDFKAGTITLNGANLVILGQTTADVTVTVTGGQATLGLSKVTNLVITSVESDDGETITTTATFGSYAVPTVQDVTGNVTVKSGEISITSTTKFSNATPVAKLTVSEGATLKIAAEVTLADSSDMTDLTGVTIDVNKYISDKATFVVDGTVNVDKDGTIMWGVSDINGQLNILKGGEMDLTIVKVDGTVTISEDVSADNATMEIAIVYGTVTGDMEIDDLDTHVSGFVLAYPGSNITLYTDDEGNFTGAKTEVYLNGDLVFTAYAKSSPEGTAVNLATIDKFVYKTGLDKDTSEYYSDAALTQNVQIFNSMALGSAGNYVIGSIETLYIEMEPAEVTGVISTGVGLSIYLNGISADAYKDNDGGYILDVGTYTVTIENSYGYDKSTATISFNGTTVSNGGTITVTEDGFVLTATGASISVPSTPGPAPTPVEPTEKDDSMGITEYLLIVLVILAAILVVVVAVRMMRS